MVWNHLVRVAAVTSHRRGGVHPRIQTNHSASQLRLGFAIQLHPAHTGRHCTATSYTFHIACQACLGGGALAIRCRWRRGASEHRSRGRGKHGACQWVLEDVHVDMLDSEGSTSVSETLWRGRGPSHQGVARRGGRRGSGGRQKRIGLT